MPSPSQQEVVTFLQQTEAWKGGQGEVVTIETHGALVFMCGDQVLKIKRAVRLPYFDFSTLEKRRCFITREFEINAVNAPGIYTGVVAITREAGGSLAVGGCGTPVEWALAMQRFDQHDLLSHIVEHGGLQKSDAAALAEAIASSHARAPVRHQAADRTDAIATDVLENLQAASSADVRAAVGRLEPELRRAAGMSKAVRDRRARDGYIRRCHGDLHLGNAVLWHGVPVLFDALEFDEDLATIDPLYDLAFLLMDLERHGARESANIVLNRYLWRGGDLRDIEGLCAMPFYLALRAAIRAMVALDRARAHPAQAGALNVHAEETLQFAARFATPPPARLIAVGGLSGTGKTTLAGQLAPLAGAAPGAVHLRTDLERKWLAGAGELDRLPESAYTQEASHAVFDRVFERARAALAAGQSVVIDGVFAHPGERDAVEGIARRAGVAFDGIWLQADAAVLKQRVTDRTGDASDATPAVVDMQLAMDTGERNWPAIECGGPPRDVSDLAVAKLGLDRRQARSA